MPAAVNAERFLRIWPGRIRVEVFGLLQNQTLADKIRVVFVHTKGVLKADPCCATGRLLILFDEKQLSADGIFRLLLTVERQSDGFVEPEKDQVAVVAEPMPITETARNEAAVADERVVTDEPITPAFEDSPEPPMFEDWTAAIKKRPPSAQQRASPQEKVPLPLGLAMGGLMAIGAKQLLFGQSALARSPVPFYLAGLVSVVTGYPFIKRGLSQLSVDKKINTDLMLGTGALALALVRENLVVLAGFGILQYVNWKRSRQASADGQPPVELSPDIRDYSEKAGKIGVAAAAATWALTRDPLRGVAVLLAANPRPATIPAEVAWRQAEVELKEQGIAIPARVSLSQLSRTRTLLLEDASLVVKSAVGETECVSHEDEPDKLVCAAASLLEKTDHPWKEDVWRRAKSTCRTIRTAFHVTAEEDGTTGTVQNTVYAMGTMAYCQRHDMSCESYYLEAKRLKRAGFDVLFVGKSTNKGLICHGLIYRQQAIAAESLELLQTLCEQGFDIAPLRSTAMVEPAAIAGLGMNADWLTASEGDAVERIAAMHQQGYEAMLVTGQHPNAISRYLQEAGVPAVPFDRLDSVLAACCGARKVESTVNEHFQITKKWNVVGSALATIGLMSAPLVNLASDALSLLFMSRSGKTAAAAFPGPASRHEVATAAEALQWHAEPWDRIANGFGVNERTGLSAQQVKAARNRFGPNRLEQKKPVPWATSYIGQFKEFTTLVLVGTSLLAFFAGGMFDGLAMSAVLLVNAAISTYQERKAEQVLQSLGQFQPPESTVLRNGERERISAVELVPGDIVSLEAGDRVPADLRIFRSWNMEVNEAALTGESVPAAKSETAVGEQSPIAERHNMLYMGTDVCRGKALGVVVQTGMRTEIGHLMSLLNKDDKEVTPLQQKVTSISKTFVKWACIAGSLVFVTGLLRGIPVAQMISTSITLAASAIPEGLPVTITIALSAGIFRMAKKKVFVRKLSALETLGRTTVICSDKTGTLTKNEMTVKQIAAVGQSWSVTGNGYAPTGTIQTNEDVEAYPDPEWTQPELRRMMQIAVLCNNSSLQQTDDGWTVQGDPTEGALLFMAAKADVQPEDMSEWHRCEEIPFDSNSSQMSVVCKHVDSERECYLFSKGSVESILRRCGKYQRNGETFDMTDDIRSHIVKQNENLAGGALRVLGFAFRPLDASEDWGQPDDENQMIYVGMAGMIDPPKPGVEQSIQEARAIGVKPVMITGDHPITAIAIAKQIGIYCEGCQVLSGYELERLTDEELDRIADEVSIFARVTPEQKLRIVKAFQRQGHSVAMTGDGVNDSPAIKQANVGIAMGQTGTEVTKETADIVLQEDHFGSIVEGVKEGRTIIGNIRKALGCLLTGNLAEIIVTSAAVMVGLPIPLVPIQILLMNLLTDALPAMVLAVNPGAKTYQTQRMDIVDKTLYQKVVTRGVLLGLASLGLFAFTLASGAPVPVAQSVAFATLVAGQLVQTLNWRREGTNESVRDLGQDRFMMGAIGLSWLALLAALYVPPIAAFFHTAPLTFRHWMLVLPVAASISLLSKPLLAALSRNSGIPHASPAAAPAFAAS